MKPRSEAHARLNHNNDFIASRRLIRLPGRTDCYARRNTKRLEKPLPGFRPILARQVRPLHRNILLNAGSRGRRPNDVRQMVQLGRIDTKRLNPGSPRLQILECTRSRALQTGGIQNGINLLRRYRQAQTGDGQLGVEIGIFHGGGSFQKENARDFA